MKKVILLSIALTIGVLLVSCGKEDPQKKEEGQQEKEWAMEAVDLGLKVKWASCNLGASKPWEYGGYYLWAGKEDVSDLSIDLYWDNCPYHNGTNMSQGWTKYNSGSSYGTVDNKTVLDLKVDDVAHAELGGKWRMPTEEECKDLIDNCDWSWTDNYKKTGVSGSIFTSRKYPDRSIFLPAAGFRAGTLLNDNAKFGYYWSASRSSSYTFNACYLYFDLDGAATNNLYRYFGRSVRPVSD